MSFRRAGGKQRRRARVKVEQLLAHGLGPGHLGSALLDLTTPHLWTEGRLARRAGCREERSMLLAGEPGMRHPGLPRRYGALHSRGGGDARFPADLCDARGTGRCHRCAAPDRLRVPPRCGDRGTGACSVTDGEGGRVAIEVVLRERGPATDDQMQRPITDVRSDIRGRGEVAIREPGVLRVDRLELLARLARSRGMRERSTGRSSAGTCRPPERTGGRRSVCAGPGGGAVGVVTGPRPRQARGSAARPSDHGAGSRPG